VRSIAKIAAGVAMVSCIALSLPVRANLIQNGGFETGDFTDWVKVAGQTYVATGQANSGTYSVWLGQPQTLGYLSQSFATTPGATYDLSYFFAVAAPGANEFQVSVDGNVLVDQMFLPPQAYAKYDFQFTATGSTSTLQFGFRDDPAYMYLDDVSVTTVPLPAALPLFTVGLAGIAGVGRFRRARS